jgi:hypothetical protein
MRQGRGGGRRRARWWAAAAGTVVVLLATSGCGAVQFVQDTVDDMATAGEPPALVTAAEKEVIGYEVPAGMSNSRLQELALAHREEIYAAVQPKVEEQLGRPVEMGRIVANVPRSSLVVVNFRTLDEPIVSDSMYLSLGSDGSVQLVEPLDRNVSVERLTVEGLYQMAYRERIAQMRDYLLTTYPQFVAMPDEYARCMTFVNPMIWVSDGGWYGESTNADERNADESAVYAAYLEDPDRSDEEWQAVFEATYGDRELSLHVSLMLADPAEELTEEVSWQIAEDVRSNPVFAGYGSWVVFTNSNLMLRDGSAAADFHQRFTYTADRGLMNWIVAAEQDGYTLWHKGGLSGPATPGSENTR